MIICRTPYRISFFGGGTDYPGWYRQHGGTVLATTINKYCWLTCRHLPPFFEHRFRIVYRQIETCKSVEEIEHPAVRAALQYLKVDRGIELHHDGDLPARSGIGSSSSFMVGLLHVLHALRGEMPSTRQLTRESIRLEQKVLSDTVGSQDQVMAANGGFRHVRFLKGGEIRPDPIVLPTERLAELESHLMLVYTGIVRTSSDVAKSYATEPGKLVRPLSAMSEMVDKGLDILGSGMDIRWFGDLLHEAWEIKREFSKQVSNPEIDDLYEKARSAGAIGGKLTGAGGGGFLLLFVEPHRQADVLRALGGRLHVPFAFEPSGSRIVFHEDETDYREAERIRLIQPPVAFKEMIALRAEAS